MRNAGWSEALSKLPKAPNRNRQYRNIVRKRTVAVDTVCYRNRKNFSFVMEHGFGLSVFKAVLAGVVCLRCHFDATVLSGPIIAYSNPMVVKEHARMNFDRRHMAIDAALLRRNRAGSSSLLVACRMTRNTLVFIDAVTLVRRMHVWVVASRTGQMVVRFQITP